MELLHDSIRGAHLLHWLTFAVPLSTLVVVGGMLRVSKASKLLLLGVVATFATLLLHSNAPQLHQVRYGAPLPIARAGIDITTGELLTSLTVLRTSFVADLLFWCSSAVLLGLFIQSLVRRLPRRHPVGSRA